MKYGMDISKPSIPYDGSNVLNPLWMFGFFSNEVVLRTLKLLLDNGLSADDADECWGHAIFDLANIDGDLMTDFDYEVFNDYIRKLMLIASYPHVLNEDEYLRDEIWFQYNDYDVTKFRNWNNYAFDVDTSHCIGNPHVCGSVVTIIEKTTGKPVWKFGVCLKPEEIE